MPIVPVRQSFIDGLVRNPRESLATELKDWLDPDIPHGQAKIVKACIAMRNQDGGYLQIGFEDGTGKPNPGGAPQDVHAAFDQDKIQGLVSKYASQPFEVHVRFAERDGQEFPVLEVETGVRSPVAAKKEIPDPNDASKRLVKIHSVYVRSLSASGVVGTTEAQHGDWQDLTRRCFDNLEADVGRFARRHLGAVTPETARLLAEALGSVGDPGPVGPPPEARALELLRYGYDRFQDQQRRRNLTRMPQHGYWQAAALIDGDVPEHRPTREFLNRLSSANPNYTGWPLWIDSRGFVNETDDRNLDQVPGVREGGWEAFLYRYERGSWFNHLDFWRAEPAGRFYLYRGFEDDIGEGEGYPESMKTLDFGMVIWRTAEAIGTTMAFARAMGLVPEETTLRYVFSWTGLRGREVSSWTNLSRDVSSGYVCEDHEVESPMISVPLDAPNTAVASYVRAATADLFAAFSGFEPGAGVTEDLAEQLLNRNL